MKKIIIIIVVLTLILISFIGGYFLLKPKTIIITFNTDGGTKVNNIKIIEENKIKLPNTTKDGYEFDGWYIDDKKIDDNYIYTTDTLLKAKWKKIITYQVIFNSNGGSIIENIVLKEGETFIFPSPPEKEDYNFIGWKDENGNYVQDNFVITTDILLIAEWEYKYYCEDGFVLENKKCIKNVTISANIGYTCPEGYGDIGKGMCHNITGKVDRSLLRCGPDQIGLTPEGFCLSNEINYNENECAYNSKHWYNNKCYINKEMPLCPDGTNAYIRTGFHCFQFSNGGPSIIHVPDEYTCPSGYKLNGKKCNKTIIEEAKIKK